MGGPSPQTSSRIFTLGPTIFSHSTALGPLIFSHFMTQGPTIFSRSLTLEPSIFSHSLTLEPTIFSHFVTLETPGILALQDPGSQESPCAHRLHNPKKKLTIGSRTPLPEAQKYKLDGGRMSPSAPSALLLSCE